ncbi:serine hydrolase domain-containing protein [Frateuria sp. Soil773]|uniref:serine hydrolase domain-containing protein n=1 Tax=Frateuria sp. Soil773 TaxID=1736407 RepID=UPI00138F3C88|nr:serine hydrolase domain-containing protein [Frateuria sp. Soil773]
MRIPLLGLLLAASAACNAARAGECPSQAGLRSHGVPGAVIVSLAGQRTAVSACGLADTARRRPMSGRTVFQAASLSKPVVSLIALKLAGQKRLDLDKPLAGYLHGPYRHDRRPLGDSPQWDSDADPRLAKVTARMVLSHRSGLPNWAFGEPLRFVADPGTRWNYSGEGFAYLAAALEAIAGQPLQPLADAQVFRPLGMRDSSFVWRDAYAGRVATGYDKRGHAIDTARFRRPIAAASLYTTPADYAKFVRALLLAAPGTALALERQRQTVVDAKYALGWGLGVGIETRPDGDCAFHHGINEGFQSFFMACPGSGRGVLWFTNSDRGLELAPAMLEAYVPGKHPLLGWPVLRP